MSEGAHDTLIAGPARRPLSGKVIVPGDKSISHRTIILASLAGGISEIHGFLPGEDNLATARMFEQMGVRIEWLNETKTRLRIHGVGLHGLKQPEGMLDAGNSGTCARLMAGVLAGQSFTSTVTGDASLRKRPMRRITEPLRRMGAQIEGRDGDGRDGGNLLPLSIEGGSLKGIHHVSKIASAQVKSCILLAGLYAEGETRVREPKPSRDHTERMLPLFGQPLHILDDGSISLKPTGELTAPNHPIHIPADPSSATFFAVAAGIVEGSEIRMDGIGINPRRDGWRRILGDMGAAISVENESAVGEEPVADISVCHDAMNGIHVNPDDIADAIDEFPALFVAAALADGEFILEEAEELRVKESDRIAAMATALSACGATVQEQACGLRIQGHGQLTGGVTIDARGDHRIAMAMAVAAQRATDEITIQHAGAIATSFPDFVPLAQAIGMNVRWVA
ncbi:MAG: 3-phosphoshikimate 1-carboxyvinyltransferase [Zetaproteobacteria bacterium]|nr:MAG: 3-phosphoshikimate 1-carboxyvinyltransferase [Zetaproteobacteria bacterium]